MDVGWQRTIKSDLRAALMQLRFGSRQLGVPGSTFGYLHKFLLSVWIFLILVRMVLEGKFPERSLDVLLFGRSLHAKELVVVFARGLSTCDK